MKTIPKVLRNGFVELEHDPSDDEVRIKYTAAGTVCFDYLKCGKHETFDAFVDRVIAYVSGLKL